MTANEETITLKKSVLITKLMAVEKSLAWQDFVLCRLCLDLGLVRQEVQDLVMDPMMLKVKSDLVDYLFPDNDFTPLMTDTLLDTWNQEFEKIKSPITNYDKGFYRRIRSIPDPEGSSGVLGDTGIPH